jgi:excisionase family DNA binding protein
MLKDELINRYGLTMTTDDIAEIFHISKGTLYNLINAKKLGFEIFKMGNRRLADTIDVAEYIEDQKYLD